METSHIPLDSSNIGFVSLRELQVALSTKFCESARILGLSGFIPDRAKIIETEKVFNCLIRAMQNS